MTASAPVPPSRKRAAGASTRSSGAATDPRRRFAAHTPQTRNGVEKYSPAHNQKATWS